MTDITHRDLSSAEIPKTDIGVGRWAETFPFRGKQNRSRPRQTIPEATWVVSAEAFGSSSTARYVVRARQNPSERYSWTAGRLLAVTSR